MTPTNTPRIFTSLPVSTDNLTVGDMLILNGLVRTYMGAGQWLTSQNDVLAFGTRYYVDSVNGLDGNAGLTWATALKTIAAAVALAVAGDIITYRGSFNEAVVIPVTKTGLQLIGNGTGPNQAQWTAPDDGVCLTINATDVLAASTKFRPPAYTSGTPAAIVLGGAGYARIIGNRFQGKAGSKCAIYSPVCDSDNVKIQGNEFIYLNNITTVYGAAILGVEAGGLSYSSWVIKGNDFNAPVEGINICGRGCLIEGNHFRVNGLKADNSMGAVTGSAGSKKMIDLSGTSSNSNHVHGNYLGGAYNATLYAASAGNDDWSGNYNIAGITAANPV